MATRAELEEAIIKARAVGTAEAHADADEMAALIDAGEYERPANAPRPEDPSTHPGFISVQEFEKRERESGSWMDAAIDGAFFNFSDEADGVLQGIRAKMRGDDYDQAYDEGVAARRTKLKNYAADHPFADFAARMAGATAITAPLGGWGGLAAGGGRGAATVATGTLTRELAKQGAKYGLVAGIGAGEDGLADRAFSGGVGALLGGLGGALMGKVAPHIDKGLTALKGKFGEVAREAAEAAGVKGYDAASGNLTARGLLKGLKTETEKHAARLGFLRGLDEMIEEGTVKTLAPKARKLLDAQIVEMFRGTRVGQAVLNTLDNKIASAGEMARKSITIGGRGYLPGKAGGVNVPVSLAKPVNVQWPTVPNAGASQAASAGARLATPGAASPAGDPGGRVGAFWDFVGDTLGGS